MIITVAQKKGGAGKTTLLLALAEELARRRFRVQVVDADPNANAHTYLTAMGQAIPSHHTDGPAELKETLKAARADSEAIHLVDTPGFASETAIWGMSYADVVLVPTKDSEFDVAHALETARNAADLHETQGRAPNVHMVFTRVDPRTVLSRFAREKIDAEGIPVFARRLSTRQAFKEALSGMGMPTSDHAGVEVAGLTDELLDLLDLPRSVAA